jgi:lysophospholipase L1-like esterase
MGATLTPSAGTRFLGNHTPQPEATRQAVNEWIRGSGAYDNVVDADVVLRDPAQPTRLRADHASSDFIHPNDRGYRAIADAVDVSMLRRARQSGAR